MSPALDRIRLDRATARLIDPHAARLGLGDPGLPVPRRLRRRDHGPRPAGSLLAGPPQPRGHPTFALASSGLFRWARADLSLGMLALFLDLEHKLYVWRLYLTMQAVVADVVGRVDPAARLSRCSPPAVLLDPPAMARSASVPRLRPLVAAARPTPAVRRAVGFVIDRPRRGARHLHRASCSARSARGRSGERAPRPAVPRVRPVDGRRLRPLPRREPRRARAAGLARQPVPRRSSSSSSACS